MEVKNGLNSPGFTVKGDEAPQAYRVEPSVENPGGQFGGSTAPPATAAPPPSTAAPAQVPSTEMKKRRGRPRKYSGDGSAVALSPMPISASIPFAGDYSSAWKHSASRPVDAFKKKPKLELENSGMKINRQLTKPENRFRHHSSLLLENFIMLVYVLYPVIFQIIDFVALIFNQNDWISSSSRKSQIGKSSGSFIPHMLTVNTGEDIMMKIISFSQQGSRAICILAANGTISNVTLRQPNSSGGTLTYEGRFEILSLTGSFMPSDNGLTKSRSGGMSVSLAGPDGRVMGGGLAGMLVAAGPVQIVIGSFPLPGQQQQEQQKPKKPNYEHTISFTPVDANPISEHRYEASSYNGPKPNLTASASFNLANVNSTHGPHGPKITDNHEHNATLPGGDSREPSHVNHEITS
ncbi:AT hook motif DNA-binding family protein [Striga asiatica]|uniref:AT-hook motif nuclear-localized protein n=1 Tax=Striga asiatica TaxID=4170 RepID=A0A5A7PQE6_STRAF|nr:AT hook motif DNA-binding family protein [Striga asiatica]